MIVEKKIFFKILMYNGVKSGFFMTLIIYIS